MTTLVAVCGRTPQVITETLWGLAREGLFPERMVVLTTAGGRSEVERHLLGEGGRIATLAALLGLESPEVMLRSSSAEDISSSCDADEFLELAMEAAREATEVEGSRTIFSVAGGRKTMGVALALAAQCHARGDDLLVHTLVPVEFESSRFFHPVPGTDSENVAVTLVRMPFFRLRGRLLPDTPTAGAARQLAEAFSGAPSIEMDVRARTIGLAGTKAALPPVLLAVYLFFLSRRDCLSADWKACPEDCMRCALTTDEIVARSEDISRLYGLLKGAGRSRGGRGIEHISAGNFLSYRSRIAGILVKAFGEMGGSLGIVRVGPRRQARYCIRLPLRAVCFADDMSSAMLRNL